MRYEDIITLPAPINVLLFQYETRPISLPISQKIIPSIKEIEKR